MENTEQIDWVSIEDKRACLRKLLADGAERVGIPQLSHWLNEDPSTLRNQLAHRERKRPSAELENLVWLLDAEYRQDKAGQCDELVVPKAKYTADEALRLIIARAESAWDRRAVAELATIISHVGKAEDIWERIALSKGWIPPR